LRRRAQDYDHTDKSSPFPKKETDAVCTSLRCHVSAIKGRSRKAAPIAKKIAQTRTLFARRPESITLERFSCEEIVRNRPRPSRDHRQSRIVLKGEADYVIWHRGREQPLNGFPVRANV
jgi:hypothetical protein